MPRIFVLVLLFAGCLTAAAQESSPCGETAHTQRRIFRQMRFDRPPLMIEDLGNGRTLITNSYQEALTAYVVDIGPLPKDGPRRLEPQDALTRRGVIAPIPRGLSYSTTLPSVHGPGAEPPKIIAALWEDGSSFGPTEALEKIYEGRKASIQRLDEVIGILQRGIQEGWTSEQLLAAIEAEQKKSSIQELLPGLLSTIRLNASDDGQVRGLGGMKRFLTHLVEFYGNQREALVRGLPQASNDSTR